MRQRLPTFMREGAADTEVTRRVKRYVNSIDKFRFGHTVVFSVTFMEEASCCSVPAEHQYMQLYIDRCIPQGDRIVCVAICFNFCITPSHRHMDSEIFHLLFAEAVVTSVLYLLVLMVQLLLCFFVT